MNILKSALFISAASLLTLSGALIPSHVAQAAPTAAQEQTIIARHWHGGGYGYYGGGYHGHRNYYYYGGYPYYGGYYYGGYPTYYGYPYYYGGNSGLYFYIN